MDKYYFTATVNYPEAEVQAPDYNNLILDQVGQLVKRLLSTERDATSFVITIVKHKGEQSCSIANHVE